MPYFSASGVNYPRQYLIMNMPLQCSGVRMVEPEMGNFPPEELMSRLKDGVILCRIAHKYVSPCDRPRSQALNM